MANSTPTRKRYQRSYTPEFKARVIEVCLRAVKFGWSVQKFAKRAGIPRVTVLDWLSEDGVFEQYRRAMETKALEIPSIHFDVIKKVIRGEIDAKAGRAAMMGLEFRMMREIKKIYEPSSRHTHDHKHAIEEMSEAELRDRAQEIINRAIEQRAQKGPDEETPGPTIN